MGILRIFWIGILATSIQVAATGCGRYSALDSPPGNEPPYEEIVPTGNLSIGLTFAERVNQPQNEYAGLIVEIRLANEIIATQQFDGLQLVRIDELPLDQELELHLNGLDSSGEPSYFARAAATISSEELSTRIEAHLAPAYTFDDLNGHVTIWPEEYLTSLYEDTAYPYPIHVDDEATAVLTEIVDTSEAANDRRWIRVAWHYEYENESAHTWDDEIWVFDADSPWPRFRGLELRRYYDEPSEDEREQGATSVLLIDILHPLRIFYDFDAHSLTRVDFIPITYREVQSPMVPDGW